MPTDIPGLNSEQLRRIEKAVDDTCFEYQPSRHGNAYDRKNGEDAVCVMCSQSQWRHWLKQLLATCSEPVRTAQPETP